MELLFKRQQSSGKFLKVAFKLWGKIELSDEEQEIMKRYSFGDAYLIEEFQPKLIRNSAIIGFIAWFATFAFFSIFLSTDPAVFFGLLAGAGTGYWWFHKRRETIYVKDLLQGRFFSCRSIVALARKEAWLEQQVSVFRQVMESAKHWDGTETFNIPALPKAEAKELMLQAA